MENLELILLFVAAAAFGQYLLFRARKRGKAWQAGLKTLCDRHGWQLGPVDPARGMRSGTAISCPDESWRVSFHRMGSGVSGTNSINSGDRWTVWLEPALALDHGLAVLGPAIPDKTREKTQQMLERSGVVARVMLDAFIKGIDRKKALGLRVVEGRVDPARATLLATPGSDNAFDALINSREWEQLTRFEGRIGDRPPLIRDEDGLKFRVERTLKEPDDIVAFVKAGRLISEKLSSAEIGSVEAMHG
ncbi:MAG: hypothetical protein AAGI72_05355 [Pseudomonadota bacterium]